MKKSLLGIGIVLFTIGTVYTQNKEVEIDGELRKWHKITLRFAGSALSEHDKINPFLNYRLNVTFKNQDKIYVVPGFYAADGNAAETGADQGNVWKVIFRPDKVGVWTYEVSFRKGDQVAISDDPSVGTAADFDGLKGTFNVSNTNKTGRDFRAHGRLEYVGERYLQFAESGAYFLKGGADSPENFLGYYEFDQTPATHKYEAHAADWKQGDPVWQNGKGKNIIGALNYLASKGMNAVYFLTMNVQGDGKDVWPWNNRNERYRFDCSKLDQWEVVFDHMDHLGLMLHIVTQETENELLLDIGTLGVQRKLYYRELIARFSHHLAVTWNLGEENGPVHWSPKGQNDQDRKAMAKYIKKNDPYQNFVVLHTHARKDQQDQFLRPLLGYTYLDGPSVQIHHPEAVHEVTTKWIEASRNIGRNWVVHQDEIGPANTGAKPDKDDPTHDKIRHSVLWGNLMAGGAGVEWYFGYKYAHNDLNCEDWRSRDNLWEQTKYALDFFQMYLPFKEMKSADGLTDHPDDYVLAKNGQQYAIYLPNVVETYIDLFGTKATYNVRWYNPRTGGKLQKGSVRKVKGGKRVSIGFPPERTGDWVALLRTKKSITNHQDLQTKSVISLEALNDFQVLPGHAIYYKDHGNKALAIHAEDKSQRNTFAASQALFKGKSGLYTLSFMTTAENDGASSYVIHINGKPLDTITNPEVTVPFKVVQHDLGKHYIHTHDIIQVQSNAVTNGKIPEQGETAWSRGRWQKVVFTPVGFSVKEHLKNATAFEEKDGFIEVEAEAFQYQSSRYTKRNWYIRSEGRAVPFDEQTITHHYKEASNHAYIEALPDTRITHADPLLEGENFFPTAGTGGTVSYKVNFSKPGKYYVWVRAYSSGAEDNGVHVGLNGTWPESGARLQWCKGKHQWTWSSAQRVPENHCGTPRTVYLDIEKPGSHIISFSMREDGFEMDKWVMTRDAEYAPK